MTNAQTDDTGRLSAARDKVSETTHAALDTASGALNTAKDKAGSAFAAASEGIEANPLAALVGGIAVGLIAGALLPRSQKEAELLGPLGARLADAAREAASAAREAGLASFDEAGFNRDAIQAQVSKLLDGATKAAGAAGGAAVQAVRKPAA